MAGLTGSTQNGWRITFRLDNQPRQFRFRGSKTNANAIKLHIENIIEARGTSGQLVKSTAAWLDDIEDKFYEKLRGTGPRSPNLYRETTGDAAVTLEHTPLGVFGLVRRFHKPAAFRVSRSTGKMLLNQGRSAASHRDVSEAMNRIDSTRALTLVPQAASR